MNVIIDDIATPSSTTLISLMWCHIWWYILSKSWNCADSCIRSKFIVLCATKFLCAIECQNIFALNYGRSKKHDLHFTLCYWHGFSSLLVTLPVANKDLYSTARSNILVVVVVVEVRFSGRTSWRSMWCFNEMHFK